MKAFHPDFRGKITDKDMQWEGCICVDMKFSHSDPLIRRCGERTMSPYSLETLRLIEEYGSEEEEKSVDLEEEIVEAANTDQAGPEASRHATRTTKHH
jgi:hypothetical protein